MRANGIKAAVIDGGSSDGELKRGSSDGVEAEHGGLLHRETMAVQIWVFLDLQVVVIKEEERRRRTGAAAWRTRAQ